MATFLFAPTPHEEAAAFLRNKPAVSRAVFDKLVPELKARAFTIAGIEGLGVLTSVRDTIATLPEGGDWETLKKQIVSDIDPFFVDPEADAETQGKQRYAAERRAELLLRTHGQQAYAAAAWREADEQRDLFPFWKYQTLGDGNVRPSHAALDGIVLPHDDPFWATHTPPWDWGCRCQFIPLSDADVAEIQDADRGKPPEQRSILGEGDRKKLNDERVIYRPSNLATGTGHPVPYSVASPAERGKPNAYTFRPGDLRLDAAAIQSRHDPKDWALFEKWAKKQQLPDQKLTVWEWMNGTKVLPPDASPVLPPVAAKTWAETLSNLGLGAAAWTATDAGKLIAALAKPGAVKVTEKITGFSGADKSGEFSAATLRSHAQDFLTMLPTDIARDLPAFNMEIVNKSGFLGEYEPGAKTLRLSKSALKMDADPLRARETLFHEMTHWLHLHGPAEWRANLKAHFDKRTAGEKIVQLVPYRGSGKRDKWYDAYAGRIYDGNKLLGSDAKPSDGLELPTRHLQLLANPAKLARQTDPTLNPHAAEFIESLGEVLSILL